MCGQRNTAGKKEVVVVISSANLGEKKPKPEPEPSLRFPIQPSIAHYFLLLFSFPRSLSPAHLWQLAISTQHSLRHPEVRSKVQPVQHESPPGHYGKKIIRPPSARFLAFSFPSPIFSFNSSVTLLAVARTHPRNLLVHFRVESISCCRSSCPLV